MRKKLKREDCMVVWNYTLCLPWLSAERWPMKEKTLSTINSLRLQDAQKLIMGEKTLLDIMMTRCKVCHSSSKPRKDFGCKPSVRIIQVTIPDSSDSGDSSNDQDHPYTDEEGEDETFKAWVLKAALSFEKEHGQCLKWGKNWTLCKRMPRKQGWCC